MIAMATLTAVTAMTLEPLAQRPETLMVPFIHWTVCPQSTCWLNHKISFHRRNESNVFYRRPEAARITLPYTSPDSYLILEKDKY